MDITKPEVDYPEGAPPKDLQITGIWEGDGKVAGPGDTVEVHYVGVAFSSGEEFDASWNRGEPLSFRLGVGQVIQGWDQGGARPSSRVSPSSSSATSSPPNPFPRFFVSRWVGPGRPDGTFAFSAAGHL